jgi:hypothetical protein
VSEVWYSEVGSSVVFMGTSDVVEGVDKHEHTNKNQLHFRCR